MAAKKYDVFKAIADPTRRKIISILLASGTLSLTALAGDFDISRQSVTKHVNILEKAGLISINDTGRERYCQAEFQPLKEVFDWISMYEKFWEEKMNSLEIYLKQQKTK